MAEKMDVDPYCSRAIETILTSNRLPFEHIRDQLSQLLALADRTGDHVLAAHISLALARADERLAACVR